MRLIHNIQAMPTACKTIVPATATADGGSEKFGQLLGIGSPHHQGDEVRQPRHGQG